MHPKAKERWLARLASVPPWLVILLSILGAEAITAAIASLMSHYFFGRVTREFLITGGLASLAAASLIGGLLVVLGHLVVEGERRFHTLIQYAHVAIATFEPDGHFIDCNQSWREWLGYSYPEMSQHTYLELIHPDDRPTAARLLEGMVRGRGDHPYLESRWLCQNGSTHWGGASLSLLKNMRGQPMEVMIIVQDIDGRKKNELELQAAIKRAEEMNSLKDKFVSLVAHDVRGPVSSMTQLTQALLKDDDPPLAGKHREWAELVVSRGWHTLQMADDLLRLNQLQTGRLEAEMEIFDLSSITQEALQYGHQAQAKSIQLNSLVPRNCMVCMDHRFVRQVVSNLVINAIKFCKAGDKVEMAMTDPATLVVRDTGPGMEPAFAERIFLPHVKTTTLGSAGEQGTGLGLPLCAELMAAQGGEIWVETAPGKGAAFFLRFKPIPAV